MNRMKASRLLANALLNQSVVLAHLNRWEDAVLKCDELIAQFGNSTPIELPEKVGEALINKAIVRGEQGNYDDSLEACNQILARFGDSPVSELRSLCARALYSKGLTFADERGDLEAAASCFSESAMIFLSLEGRESLRRRGDALIRKAHTLGLDGKEVAALEIYEALTAELEPQFKDCPRQVASGWLNQALLMSEIGRFEESLLLLRQIIERCHTHLSQPVAESEDYRDIRRILANAWLNITADLAALGREPEKIATCIELIEEFQDEPDCLLRTIVARARFNLARGYEEVGQVGDAIAEYQKINEKLASDPAPEIQVVVAQSLVNKTLRLSDRGDIEGSISVGLRTWHTFGNAEDPTLRKQACMALANTARVLAGLQDSGREIEIFTEILRCADQMIIFGLDSAVAFAHFNRAEARWKQDRYEEALQDWNDLLTSFVNSTDEVIVEFIFKAFCRKAGALRISGNIDAEIECYKEALDFFRQRTSHNAHIGALWAYYTLGWCLTDVKSDYGAAVATWEEGLTMPYLSYCNCCEEYASSIQASITSLSSPDASEVKDTR